MCPPHVWVLVPLSLSPIADVSELINILTLNNHCCYHSQCFLCWQTLSVVNMSTYPLYKVNKIKDFFFSLWRLFLFSPALVTTEAPLLPFFFFRPPWNHKSLYVYLSFTFLCLIANQDKTSRKHITSPPSSNPEPRKESLPLGNTVNESSLLLEVRNCCLHMCLVEYLFVFATLVHLKESSVCMQTLS